MGILSGGLTLEARRPVSFQVFNPLTGALVSSASLSTGNRITLPQGPGAYILKGTLFDGTGCNPWTQFLDGSTVPSSPWLSFQGPGGGGATQIISFLDPDLGVTNQALRINSGTNANEWFVGPVTLDEWSVGARFRLVSFSPMGKENLLCLTTHSTPLSPAPSITLVNGRYKLWSYVSSDTELADLGPATPNQWHTTYIYARNDGRVKAWWDRVLVYDGLAPLVNPFDGYIEWGSGSWQYDATTTVDLDWIGYGNPCNLPQMLNITRLSNNVVLWWPTNASGFVLQNNSNINSSNWLTTTNSKVVWNDQYYVTSSIPAATMFFRLVR